MLRTCIYFAALAIHAPHSAGAAHSRQFSESAVACCMPNDEENVRDTKLTQNKMKTDVDSV